MNTGESSLVTYTAISGVQVLCGLTPVDAFQQHRQLRTRQTNGSFRSLRPDESASLQTLGETDIARRHRTREALRCRLGVLGKRRRDRRTAARSARSALAHSDHRSRAACRSRRPRARSSFRCGVRSLAQALKDRTQQRRIGAALHADQRPAWKLDVDSTGRRRLLLRGRLTNLRLAWSRHRNRKQGCGWSCRLCQLATLEGTTPRKYLVRVYTVRPCYQRHTRTWLHRQLYNPTLLRNRTKSADATFRSICLKHDNIVRLKPAGMPEGMTTRLRMGGRGFWGCWMLGVCPRDGFCA